MMIKVISLANYQKNQSILIDVVNGRAPPSSGLRTQKTVKTRFRP